MPGGLYYEAHITIDPVLEDRDLERLKALAGQYHFRVAELLMRKGGHHTEDSFLTARSQDIDQILHWTECTVHSLQAHGFTVRRYKIEDTVMDSKINDLIGLLQ